MILLRREGKGEGRGGEKRKGEGVEEEREGVKKGRMGGEARLCNYKNSLKYTLISLIQDSGRRGRPHQSFCTDS